MVVLLNLQGVGVGVGCPSPPPIRSPTMLTAIPLRRHTSGRWRTRSNGDFVFRCAIAEPSGEPAPLGQKTQYRDGFLEKAFMALFARKMEKFAKSQSQGNASSAWNFDYDSFVNASRRVTQGRSRLQQQQVVREVLLSMLPPGAPAQFRKLFPPTKWAAEFNAALTVPFFHWLVGPSEVVEVEINGEKQRSGVHIKKCRYLENSGCVGMCVNMCKIPTQDFFTNELGLPLTMNPNFEDMSCDMLFGQMPPSFEEDPVSKQSCYANLFNSIQPNRPLIPTNWGQLLDALRSVVLGFIKKLKLQVLHEETENLSY